MIVPELFLDEKTKKETAKKLGIDIKILEGIHKNIKLKKPNYHMGYEYNSVLNQIINGI